MKQTTAQASSTNANHRPASRSHRTPSRRQQLNQDSDRSTRQRWRPSLTEDSIRFGNGSAGVVLAGNVVVGPVVGASSGWVQGQGLADFADLSWDASALDATPSSGGALFGAAAPAWVIGMDLAGGPLLPPFEAGCLDAP